MQKNEYPCPCGGKVKWKMENVIIEGVKCGLLNVEYCEKCGEEYFPEDAMEIIEKKLKEKGLWGIKRKEANLWKSGSSVLLRIPKDIADKLHLKPNEKVTLYTEGKNKLIVNI